MKHNLLTLGSGLTKAVVCAELNVVSITELSILCFIFVFCHKETGINSRLEVCVGL